MTTPAAAKKHSDLPQRLISAAVGIPLLAGVVWLGGYTTAVVAALAALIAVNELLLLVKRAGWHPLRNEGLIVALAIVVAAPFGAVWVLIALGAGLVALVFAAGAIRRSATFLGDAVFTAIPTAYAAAPTAALVLLRDGTAGLQWLILVFAATFATDTGAYAVGRLIGRHKMAPSISPAKTWEGAAGGLLAAVGATIGVVALVDEISSLYAQAAGLGIAIGVISQLGDLAESKLKRIAHVKDSGILIPGHGGLMDRMDSLLLVFPIVYLASQLWD
jgi:phosphatidate cytidylyltransferase